MSKVRVSFVLDTSALQLGDKVGEAIASSLLRSAYAHHVALQASVKADPSLSPEQKSHGLSVAVRAMMLALMAEANLVVESMPEDTKVSTDMAFGGTSAIS